MKIVDLETLKTMTNGTVFCEIDKWGNFDGGLRILTGRFANKSGFNGEMGLLPWISGEDGYGMWKMFDKDNNLIKDTDFPTEWMTTDTADHDYKNCQLFAIFSKAEVTKMIRALQWALSDLEDDFDMDEVLE